MSRAGPGDIQQGPSGVPTESRPCLDQVSAMSWLGPRLGSDGVLVGS
jgi:hypothetical protein